ncbi:MAG: TIM barrel protein [Rhodothermaceae bacterium]|nr:TIM barrel protein [Rhodothermaceae bacterium]
MDRRHFMKSGLVASAAVAGGSTSIAAAQTTQGEAKKGAKFNLKFAPHFGMFKNHAGDDLIDQITFMAEAGFMAMEDNGMKGRTVETQEAIASEMGKHGMEMGVFVAHTISWREPGLVNPDNHDAFLAEIEESAEVAKRVNATWMTVVPGFVDLRLDMGYQTANVVEVLKKASGILEPHNLVMVLEPLNFYNHPGLFLTKIAQGYEVCKAVNSPACKILDDLYHQQIQEGNLIPNIDKAYDEIAYFQIGDNPGRKEPTTGEINYKNVFKHIHEKGFTGILGMEHGNYYPGKEGEAKLINAYRSVDVS